MEVLLNLPETEAHGILCRIGETNLFRLYLVFGWSNSYIRVQKDMVCVKYPNLTKKPCLRCHVLETDFKKQQSYYT